MDKGRSQKGVPGTRQRRQWTKAQRLGGAPYSGPAEISWNVESIRGRCEETGGVGQGHLVQEVFLGLDALTGLALTVLGFLVFLGVAAGFFLVFLTGVALGFLLGALEAAFLGLAAFFGVATFLTSFFVFLKATDLLGSSLLARRKDPEAPTPLVCLRTPVVTKRLMDNLIWALQ